MANNPIVLGLRFCLELAMLWIYGMLGWSLGRGPLAVVLAIGLPLAAAIVWGALISPRAAVAAPGWVRLAAEAGLFAGATWALAASGSPWSAAVFAALVIIQSAAAYDRIARLAHLYSAGQMG